jgi:hypothetical protein
VIITIIGKINENVSSQFNDFDPSILACEAVSLGEWFPTFREIVMPSSSLFDAKYRGLNIPQNAGNHSPEKA